MAFANFFDKAALAAADVLREFDVAALRAMLEQHEIAIVFDQIAASTFEGRTTSELAVNLVARFYPRIAIASSGANAEKFRLLLRDLALAINPRIEIAADSTQASVVLRIGETKAPARVPTIYVGSHGWTMGISPEEPVGCGRQCTNPFGAAAVACVGVANIFRLLFHEQLTNAEVDRTRSLSLIDFESSASNAYNPVLGRVELDDTILVGNGAIGNAAIWTLARVPEAVGQLNIVDPEPIELSNLQRYVLATQSDVGASKAGLGQRYLSETKIRAQPFEQPWAKYLETRNEWRLQHVMVAVDSAVDRQTIQGSLPLWVANAWTQPGDLGVSRHANFGEEACLTCLYFPEGQLKNEDELIAEALNLPGEVIAIRNLLHTGAAVGHEFIRRIADANGVDAHQLARFEDKPLRVFHAEVCGGVLLALGGGQNARRGREVPMAFQSALAGVLLASELVQYAAGLRTTAAQTTTRIDLLRPLQEHFSVPVARKKRCICGDPDYQAAFSGKWNDSDFHHLGQPESH